MAKFTSRSRTRFASMRKRRAFGPRRSFRFRYIPYQFVRFVHSSPYPDLRGPCRPYWEQGGEYDYEGLSGLEITTEQWNSIDPSKRLL